MDTFPLLTTERLYLRRLVPEDLPALVRHADNRRISDHILNIPFPFREPDAALHLSRAVQGFKQKNHFTFVIAFREQNELIGEIGVHLESSETAQLGYWVAEPLWGQGIVSEAISAVPPFAFEQLGLRRLYAVVDPDNPGSRRVLEKNGFQQAASRSRLLEFVLSA